MQGLLSLEQETAIIAALTTNFSPFKVKILIDIYLIIVNFLLPFFTNYLCYYNYSFLKNTYKN